MHFERSFFSSQFDTNKTRIGVPKFGCDMSADKKWNNTYLIRLTSAKLRPPSLLEVTTTTNSFISVGMHVDRLPYQICR